jgi:ankyrin repeat protein
VDGAGAFDDLVFRYRLINSNIWKTCFIQLKHKKNGGTIRRSSLTQMHGDFSLFKYFESYCQIKTKLFTDRNLQHCGPFDDFEFVIYTNARMERNSDIERLGSSPVSILSSRPYYEGYIAFDETGDRDVFAFFKELSIYCDFILELHDLLKSERCVDKEIQEKIDTLQSSFKSKELLERLNNLKSMTSNEYVRKLKGELEKCNFSLFREFLSKVKIFQSQSNEESFDKLIKEELQKACQVSHSFANSIYKKFEQGLAQWWEKGGSVRWLSEDSPAWQSVKQHLIEQIKQLSESEIQEIIRCDLNFNQQHIKILSNVIQQNTLLNIITSTNVSILSKLKTYQTLVSLGYRDSLFISFKFLMIAHKQVFKLWPCKWSAVLVIDCEKDSDIIDDNVIDNLVSFLRRYQQKVILISPEGHQNLASRLREELGNIFTEYKDTCKLLDLDEKTQKQILGENVDFQGTNIALEKLIGTYPPEYMKHYIDSDVISLLLSREKNLCVGRKLCDRPKYYVQRLLEHHIYLKDDILKKTDNAVTFAVSGLEVNKLKKYLPPGEAIYKFSFQEGKTNHPFRIVTSCSKPLLGVSCGTTKTQYSERKSSEQEDVRYIVIGKRHPENDFRNLKALYKNLHWIHMERGSFLWRESNCNIDIIRRHIDKTKCEQYVIRRIMEHDNRTMLLVAEPGMGKSTFLSYMEHEIKKCQPEVWVLRINLHEHTRALDNSEFEKECIDKFLWDVAQSPEKDSLKLVELIFTEALKRTGNVVVILDGFDEISPEYSRKVEVLIREIKERTAAKLWVSSRSSYRLKLEEIMMKLALTLQPFTRQNQIDFLEEYWNKSVEGFKPHSLRTFAEELLRLSSENFSDKDGQFTGIPLQTMMLGEAFVEEAKKHCLTGKFNLPNKFNLLALFKKFTERKFDIYFSEKNKIDCSIPQAKRDKKLYVKKHMISALMSFFSPYKLRLYLKIGKETYLKNIKFLKNGEAEQFGIITEFTENKPRFVHRCFAEYFAAMWFTENFRTCGSFISKTLFNSTYEVTRNIFDRMLAEEAELHGAVLNNDIIAVSEFMKTKKDLNCLDKGGRTALHLAASYNSTITKMLLSVPRVNANRADRILKWTPLRYADRTKSWMAMDILLQSGANADDIVLTRHNIHHQEWGQAGLWECAKKGHKHLLEFMLDSGIDVNAVVRVPENLQGRCSLIHVASFYGKAEVVRCLVERKAHISIRNADNNTSLHFAAISDNVDIIKLLLEKGLSVNLTNTRNATPLHLSLAYANVEATKTLVREVAALNGIDIIEFTSISCYLQRQTGSTSLSHRKRCSR